MQTQEKNEPVIVLENIRANGEVLRVWDDGAVTINGVVMICDLDDLYSAAMTPQGQRSATDKLGT